MVGQDLVAQRKPNTLLKRLPLICFNIAMVSVLLPGSVWLLDKKFPVTVPSLGVFLVQIAIIFVVDDFCFYWAHRAMHHSKWLYRRVHKYHHEAVAPIPIEFIYAHPLDALAGGVGTSLGLAMALLPFGEISACTLWSAVAVRMAHELQIHSGLPRIIGTYIPFLGSTEHHARHHASPTRGNYASTFTLWDWLFRTEYNPDDEVVAARAPR
jgi:sterol desaturase/sphingolipid hydroxylase (fatty acid hydroxylase superfamily)